MKWNRAIGWVVGLAFSVAPASAGEGFVSGGAILPDEAMIAPDWTGGGAAELMRRLGIAGSPGDSAAFARAGALGDGATFECIVDETLLGTQVVIEAFESVELRREVVGADTLDEAEISVVLFSGAVARGAVEIPVVALAIELQRRSDDGRSTATAFTSVIPIGEATTLELANGFVSQIRSPGGSIAVDPPDFSGVQCTPACGCLCNQLKSECERFCASGLIACMAGVLIGADIVFMGICVVGCATVGPAALPCFLACSQLVGKAALIAMADCTGLAIVCLGGCHLAGIYCQMLCGG